LRHLDVAAEAEAHRRQELVAECTVDAAMEEAVPVYVLSAALFARYRSRVDGTFGDKLLSAMRFGFGGHVEMPQ
jgi:6-phosphogluconate dehydrogenase (decarboxylating)